MPLQISKALKSKLLDAQRIVFFSGAGISAESGIPTFRGEEGIWNKMRPEELANFNAFMKNPDLVWEWYQHRRQIMESKHPNAAHFAITEIEKYYPSVIVVTQNVDNLHRRAGNTHIYELHGNIEKNYCVRCGQRYDYVRFEERRTHQECQCGGIIRPDVVWFGELLPTDQFSGAEAAAESCDMLFSIGTTGIVMPAAQIPVIAKRAGAYTAEININRTEQSALFHEILSGKAGEALSLILEYIREVRTPIQ